MSPHQPEIPQKPSPTGPRHLRIASRGSLLALWQANYVAAELQKKGATTEIIVMKTTGDRIQDRFLHEIGGKGLFVKELEQALIDETADLAVHSLKDMPAQLKAPLILPAILRRHSPYDLLIMGPRLAERYQQAGGLATPRLPLTPKVLNAFGSCTVATGSLRRQAMLARFAPEIKTAPIRGNVDTRLRKLDEGAWDAMILAEASLDRLDLKRDRITARLDMDWFIPCASQGALAIETRDNSPSAGFVREALNDFETELAVAIERQVLARLGGDCTMPFGCLVSSLKAGRSEDGYINKDYLSIQHSRSYEARAAVYTPKGQFVETLKNLSEFPKEGSPQARLSRESEDWVNTQADAIVHDLKDAGGGAILQQLKIPLPKGWT